MDAETRVVVDGVSLAVKRSGRGAPVVGLTAVGHDARDFAPLAQRTGDRCELICIEWPSHGGSGADHRPASAARYAQLIAGALPQLGVDRPIVIGNSIGGAAAILLAAQTPVRGLVLCDSGGLVEVNRTVRTFCALFERFFAAGARGAWWYPRAFSAYYRLVLPRPEAAAQRRRIVAHARILAPVLREAWASFGEPGADIRESGVEPRHTDLGCVGQARPRHTAAQLSSGNRPPAARTARHLRCRTYAVPRATGRIRARLRRLHRVVGARTRRIAGGRCLIRKRPRRARDCSKPRRSSSTSTVSPAPTPTASRVAPDLRRRRSIAGSPTRPPSSSPSIRCGKTKSARCSAPAGAQGIHEASRRPRWSRTTRRTKCFDAASAALRSKIRWCARAQRQSRPPDRADSTMAATPHSRCRAARGGAVQARTARRRIGGR